MVPRQVEHWAFPLSTGKTVGLLEANQRGDQEGLLDIEVVGPTNQFWCRTSLEFTSEVCVKHLGL